ncbi:unnamed protein product [Onchocerca flexuosa]|uniref:Uncharacterized protein n=1 Tax=Onchocerca flexuosa TaxID=387005 RepID=A0A183H3J4_9BILA|nr:unnamed protein product [Onchocerca flexuosa]
MCVVVVNDDDDSSRPLFLPLPVRSVRLSWVSVIVIRLPRGRSPTRPPTSFQTFHFAEGHEPPQNDESHGKTEEGRRDSDNTVMQQPSFETQTLLNVHLINVLQKAHHFFLTFLPCSIPVPDSYHSCHASVFTTHPVPFSYHTILNYQIRTLIWH